MFCKTNIITILVNSYRFVVIACASVRHNGQRKHEQNF